MIPVAQHEPGVFGKLPLHGDFIYRNLPSTFMAGWDEWLQLFIAGSQEKIGEAWLDIYLTSPIWRFVLSSGVVDAHHWAGILLPSVDQVGRYYPFSVLLPLDNRINPLEFLSMETPWYEAIEELSLQALDEQYNVDELVEALKTIELNFETSYTNTGQLMELNALQVNMEFEEQLPISVYPHMLESLLVKSFRSYSVWSTLGSDRIAPCLFTVQGLPSATQIPAMLDGQWLEKGWPQTYALQH